MTLKAGKLRTLLTLETPQDVRSDTGATRKEWQRLRRLYGDVSALSMSEALMADGIQASITHRVTCRYCEDVTPKRRFLVERVGKPARVLDIVGATDADGRRELMSVLVREQAPPAEVVA